MRPDVFVRGRVRGAASTRFAAGAGDDAGTNGVDCAVVTGVDGATGAGAGAGAGVGEGFGGGVLATSFVPLLVGTAGFGGAADFGGVADGGVADFGGVADGGVVDFGAAADGGVMGCDGAAAFGAGEGCGVGFASATTVGVVVTLSDLDAFEFVNCSDCDCCGRTTMRTAHSYVRPLMGCGVLARTV